MSASVRVLPLALLLAGCSGIAGISDFRVGDLEAGSDAPNDAASDAPSPPDAGTDAALPMCTAPQVPLRIAVLVTSSNAFTGITDTTGSLFTTLPIGGTFSHCVPPQTQVQLQADPDQSNAVHDWGVCGLGRRCQMAVTAATDIEVRL